MYRQFAKQWQFEHVTSSPEFPQSNGLVERTIQTLKKTIRKCKIDGSDPHLALLALRTSVNSTNTSAAFALMNRNLRTLLPTFNVDHQQQNVIPKLNSTQERYNKHAHDLPPLGIGQTVRFRENNKWDRLGQVSKAHQNPRSYVINTDKNTTIRRNRRDIIPSKSEFSIEPDDNVLSEQNTNYTQETLNKSNTSEKSDHSNSSSCDNDERSKSIQNQTTEPNKTISGRTIRKPTRYLE